MLNGKTVSVLIQTYRRRDTIVGVCNAWLAEPVDEVILVDCSSPRCRVDILDGRFNHVHFWNDTGNRSRHAIALLSKGDVVIQADDDVLPHNGFAQDLVDGWGSCGGIVGIIGREFSGPNYKKDGHFCRASEIAKPKRVSFVGVVYCSGREALAFDMRDMKTPINDLYWCVEAFPELPKHVIPTTKYDNLECSSETSCLFKNPLATKSRQKYYEKVWKKGVLT